MSCSHRSSMLTSSPSSSLRCWAPCCGLCAATWTLWAWKISHRVYVHASKSWVKSRCLWLIWMLRQERTQRTWSYSHQRRKAKRLRLGLLQFLPCIFFLSDIFDVCLCLIMSISHYLGSRDRGKEKWWSGKWAPWRWRAEQGWRRRGRACRWCLPDTQVWRQWTGHQCLTIRAASPTRNRADGRRKWSFQRRRGSLEEGRECRHHDAVSAGHPRLYNHKVIYWVFTMCYIVGNLTCFSSECCIFQLPRCNA